VLNGSAVPRRRGTGGNACMRSRSPNPAALTLPLPPPLPVCSARCLPVVVVSQADLRSGGRRNGSQRFSSIRH
jgi:hypothetical protein